MKILSYTEARNGLARLMKEAEENRDVVTITRNGQSSVVIMALEEYESMAETLHLLSTPANAKRLQQAQANFEKGNFEEHELCD